MGIRATNGNPQATPRCPRCPHAPVVLICILNIDAHVPRAVRCSRQAPYVRVTGQRETLPRAQVHSGGFQPCRGRDRRYCTFGRKRVHALRPATWAFARNMPFECARPHHKRCIRADLCQQVARFAAIAPATPFSRNAQTTWCAPRRHSEPQGANSSCPLCYRQESYICSVIMV